MENPRIVSIANSKGGVGKSVITIHLAVSTAFSKGKRVLILDCDSQASVLGLYEQEKASRPDDQALVDVEALTPQRVQTFLRRFGADYDLIFIDVPRVTDSRSDSSTMMLLQNCDSVLVPVLGSEVDLLSSQTFTDAIQDTASYKQGMGEDFRVYGFINKRNQRKENEEAEKSMKKYGLEMFRQSLPDLKLFTHPSFYSSVLQYVEGERRFKPFFNEFVRKFEIRGE